jgi:hypothetical protein
MSYSAVHTILWGWSRFWGISLDIGKCCRGSLPDFILQTVKFIFPWRRHFDIPLIVRQYEFVCESARGVQVAVPGPKQCIHTQLESVLFLQSSGLEVSDLAPLRRKREYIRDTKPPQLGYSEFDL